MHPESGFRIAPNWSTNQKNDNDAIICRHDVIVKFFWRPFFFLSSLVTGPSFMSISSLVLNFWLLYEGLIRNLEFGNTSVWVFPISGDWGELGIPKFARLSLTKCYWMRLKYFLRREVIVLEVQLRWLWLTI